ncbi:hypothetical protein scyTo_0000984 [Scyliorhinus torazame]|uniref:Uncharacterized protein n=1 Tax=Scyliorhinus torazame TaxID=75743 RepID=A0A401P7H6_SCYTO|nr:hypothetical protein [Scyliorhinus torazame]
MNIHGQHGSIVGSTIASRLQGPRFDSGLALVRGLRYQETQAKDEDVETWGRAFAPKRQKLIASHTKTVPPELLHKSHVFKQLTDPPKLLVCDTGC